METALAPSNISLLRPDQIDDMEGEKETLERKLHNPRIEDKGAVQDQLRRLSKQLESQRPTPYAATEIDSAVRREAELRDQISRGMLSHEEMRKCPPGAVDRHRRWEKENKPRILEWQNIQRRLNSGNEDREVACIENFRPVASRMNMDGALIPGKQYHLPPPGAGLPVAFSDEQLALLRSLSPEIADKLGTLSNDERREVKEAITAPEAPAKRVMTEEHKKKLRDGAARARAEKAGK